MWLADLWPNLTGSRESDHGRTRLEFLNSTVSVRIRYHGLQMTSELQLGFGLTKLSH